MKAIFILIGALAALPATSAVLVGPLTNPANGHIYYLLSQNTWTGSETEAVSLGGHLVTIRNASEQDWVYSTFSGYGGALWIGLTDRDKPFTFIWTSGEPVTYTNWDQAQPDCGTGQTEFYTHIWPAGPFKVTPGKWNDYFDASSLWDLPFYGVAEVVPPVTVELHAYTAIEISWHSEANRRYQLQWTALLNQPVWINVDSVIQGTGDTMSVFKSTREQAAGYYRVQTVGN